jgi:superfamily I DNA and RNA helicase
MPNLSIDREKFISILDQFKWDIPYEVEIIKHILDNLPQQASEGLIRELYFTHLHKGVVYKAVHWAFKEDINMFTSWQELIEFLKTKSLDISKDYWATATGRTIEGYIKSGQPLAGYIITKEELK